MILKVSESLGQQEGWMVAEKRLPNVKQGKERLTEQEASRST